MEEAEKRARAESLAQRIQLLFTFAGDMIPDLDLIKETMEGADKAIGTVMAAAPLMGAMGMDFEQKEFEWNLRAKRAEALYNLVKVLKETEDDRSEFSLKQAKKAEGREQLSRIFGGL